MNERAAWLAFGLLGAACGGTAPEAAAPVTTVEATSPPASPHSVVPADEETYGFLSCGLEYDVAFSEDGDLLPTPRGTMTVTPVSLASGDASVVMAFEEGLCRSRRFPPGRYLIELRIEGSVVVARFHASVCSKRQTLIEAAVSRAEGGILYESDELPCGPADRDASKTSAPPSADEDSGEDDDW